MSKSPHNILWLLNWLHPEDKELFFTIAGAFPVRLLASVEAFRTLLRLRDGALPMLFLIPTAEPLQDSKNLEVVLNTLDKKIRSIPRLYLDRSPAEKTSLKPSLIRGSNEHMWIFQPNEESFELLKAIETLMTISGAEVEAPLRWGNLELDSLSHSVRHLKTSKSIFITPKETNILRCLILANLNFTPRKKLQDQIWGAVRVHPRTVDSHISRLRRQLEDLSGTTIESSYGKGYRLNSI